MTKIMIKIKKNKLGRTKLLNYLSQINSDFVITK